MMQERADPLVFVVNEFGQLPQEGDKLKCGGHRFIVRRMKKKPIEILRIQSRLVEE